VWLDSKTNDIGEMQKMIRQNEVDHQKFNAFLDSEWGRMLLEGILEVEKPTE
jgi:hypothetical protein